MSKISRVLAVTAGLVGLGAVAGAIAGAVVALLVGVVSDIPEPATTAMLGAAFGAPMGAVLLPIAGWLLMRRVPIGRALLMTMLGTIAGGLVGWFMPAPGNADRVNLTLGCGVVGFAIAVFVLRRAAARRNQSAADTVPLDI